MFDKLSGPDRLLLLKFLCAFAWADLEVSEKERRFVTGLVSRLGLAPDEATEVNGWLDVAPSPGSVDPKQIPREHRKLFLDAIRAVVYADGKVDPDERANLDQLRAALETD
jgi:tellurite resistance protein